MGQHPADHVFLARGQVNLSGGQPRMTEHKLHVAEGKGRVLSHPVGRGVTQRMQRRAGFASAVFRFGGVSVLTPRMRG